MQSKSPFKRQWLVCFHSNTVFLTMYNSLVYSCIYTKFGRDLWRNTKAMGHWVRLPSFSVCSEARVVQQCTEAHAGVVQDGLMCITTVNQTVVLHNFCLGWICGSDFWAQYSLTEILEEFWKCVDLMMVFFILRCSCVADRKLKSKN